MSTPAELEQNIEAYNVRTLEEYQLHKFVIFHGAELVGALDSFHNAAREAVRRFGHGPYLIRQVGAPRRIAMPASVAFRHVHAAR